ncbi:MAG: TetR family transcriptional regulator [Kineosporiaceae bacterium]
MAARELFADRGYQQTTVDAIAERAGVGRRTFFRYFRSKGEAILPDHDVVVAALRTRLAASSRLSPVRALCGGAEVIFRSYVDDPETSVQRYRLTRSVPELRDREVAMVQRYFTEFRRYLLGRYAAQPPPGEPDGSLRAEVIAGAVVSAHNQVLRDWLRSGGRGDPAAALDDAFGWLIDLFEAVPSVSGSRRENGGGGGADDGKSAGGRSGNGGGTGDSLNGVTGAGTGPGNGDDDVVVAVFRAGDPLPEVLRKIARQL